MASAAAAYQYSPAVRVTARELLFVAGQVGRDDELHVIAEPEAQFVRAFENVRTILEEAGGTLDDVVDLTTYLTSMEHLPLLARVKERFLTTEPYPAWTAIGVDSLALPGLLVEVKATAAL